MSLIIKGMNLPENDGMKELVIGRAPNGTEPITIVSGDITEFYKIIEIPAPHGRLIDADVLLDTIRYGAEGRAICDKCKSQDCQNCVIKSVYKIIRKAPTVIEAEASE